MSRRSQIALVIVGLIGIGAFVWSLTWFGRPPVPTLPGLEMTDVAPGDYELTILVPNAFGRKYYSKPVTIKRPFQISRHEITIDQWDECFRDGGCSHKAKRRSYQTGDHPVTRVTWYDAVMFTQWLSKKSGTTYRLPTEEEWAYVAFAGEDFTKDTIEQLIENRQMIQTAAMSRFRKTLPIGGNGKNAWVVSDMTGSVWEWTLTCWFSSDEENQRPWTIEQLTDPDLCPNRVVQGDERAHVPVFVDKVYTGGCGTGSPVDHIGFRVVRDDRDTRDHS